MVLNNSIILACSSFYGTENSMSTSNYDLMRDQVRSLFLKYDQEIMIQRFSLLADSEYLYIKFLGRQYRINRSTGVAEWSEDGFTHCTLANYNESMAIYDVLCCSRKYCCLSGTFAPTHSLKGIVQSSQRLGESFYEKEKLFFNQHTQQLVEACRILGGIPSGRGDVAYRIPVFDFLPVQFQFWNSDEEFSAEINILWDENVLQYMHYETLWFVAGHMVRRLQELIEKQI